VYHAADSSPLQWSDNEPGHEKRKVLEEKELRREKKKTDA
jgi:hypothetical protein